LTGGQRTLRGKWGWVLLAALVAGADLASKHLLFDPLGPHERRWLVGDWFGITKVLNRGMMWGTLPQFSESLRLARVAAALIVGWMIVTTPARARLLLLALALVLGGALGNIYDGFAHGAVRDFLLVQFRGVPVFDPFPVFNLADSAICVGVVLLALGLLLEGRRERRQAAAGEGREPPGEAGPGD
jgi:signal peptidase II